MKRVYVAGPYSADNVLGVLDNVRRGIHWATLVFEAGHAPYCPWLDMHYRLMSLRGTDEAMQVEDFQKASLAWLRVSDVLLAIPGWQQSKGTMAEIAIAEQRGIPVLYEHDGLKSLRGSSGQG